MELHSQLLSGFSAPTTHWLIHNQVCVCGCISVSALGKSKSADAITNPQQLHLQIFLPAADPVTIQSYERACMYAFVDNHLQDEFQLSSSKKIKT